MGDELRARVCTRVIAMLTPADTTAVQAAMETPPVIQRTLIRQAHVPLTFSISLIVLGGLVASLLYQVLSIPRPK